MLIGIVGKPSSGKSTFFKAATLIDVAIASYPFTTIEPNHGFAFVRVECVDKEFNTQCNPKSGYCKNHVRFVPVELMDVAGLVPGAHEGKGLGNKFLNDLNQADALIHIIDCSGETNERGEVTHGYDPVKDVAFLEYEIDMWYLDVIKRGWEKFARQTKQNGVEIEKAITTQLCNFRVTETIANESINELKLNREDITKWSEEDIKKLATLLRRKTKPILIACNKIDKPFAHENFEKIKKMFPQYTFIPCSGDSEIALKEAAKRGLIEYYPGDPDFKIISTSLTDAQKKALEFIRENVLKKYGSTGVQNCLDYAVFKFLKYLAIFPGGATKLSDSQGRVLPDCWFMPPGSTAQDFAFRIHGDIGKGMLYGIDVRTKQRISKDYKLKNRDVIEIISAAK